jgi:Kef-type K+ transport system membrane component KefB
VKRIKALAKLIGWFVWFSVALFFVTIGAGAAMGALTGDWVTGVIVMFGGGLIVVSGEIGRTMIRRMVIEVRDLQRAFTKASDTIEEQTTKK